MGFYVVDGSIQLAICATNYICVLLRFEVNIRSYIFSFKQLSN